ncbi:hypothetical protein SAMN05421579_1454 [Xenorhabdus japonica]|uniref:Uncharacterized protein n=1 Tax=Xenorhabdus japonica TaxID=53341 RepID=A0A1I5DRG8_9GAMM|nr:hypothetical protein SAMN05421579_1454 [Xenorhabdus japonica]
MCNPHIGGILNGGYSPLIADNKPALLCVGKLAHYTWIYLQSKIKSEIYSKKYIQEGKARRKITEKRPIYKTIGRLNYNYSSSRSWD